MINCFNRHPPSHSSLHTYRCWCGSDDITFGTDDEEGSRFCDLECSGDSDLICGGSSSVSLYKTEAFTLHAHKPELFELASSAVYLGCFADDKNDRVLNSVVAASDVTPEVQANVSSADACHDRGGGEGVLISCLPSSFDYGPRISFDTEHTIEGGTVWANCCSYDWGGFSTTELHQQRL